MSRRYEKVRRQKGSQLKIIWTGPLNSRCQTSIRTAPYFENWVLGLSIRWFVNCKVSDCNSQNCECLILYHNHHCDFFFIKSLSAHETLWFFEVFQIAVKHYLDFSFVFSAPFPAWKDLFSASRIFCDGRYQPVRTGMFWPAEGTSQPVTIYKK